jgi:hypothetical protein
MTRKILGGLAAALLLWPAVASATRNTVVVDPSMRGQISAQHRIAIEHDGSSQQYATRGSGILWGQSLGTVETPSNTQIDTSIRGPLNDIHPGAPGTGTSDPPQAANPKPIY